MKKIFKVVFICVVAILLINFGQDFVYGFKLGYNSKMTAMRLEKELDELYDSGEIAGIYSVQPTDDFHDVEVRFMDNYGDIYTYIYRYDGKYIGGNVNGVELDDYYQLSSK